MPPRKDDKKFEVARSNRFGYVSNLAVVYEGSADEIVLRAPDLSPTGMFINTPNHFPEGAILKVSFQLPRSNFTVEARCEVRYCLPGVGVGLEFIDISQNARQAIEEELQVNQTVPVAKST
jgi:hypothetical protein